MEQYLTLIHKSLVKNEFGQMTPTEVETVVIAESKSVTRSEFYQAIDKFAPTIVFVIKGYEYEGQTEVETEEGKRYKVIRTYRTDFEDIELTCEYKNS